jgi:cytidylate kinase
MSVRAKIIAIDGPAGAGKSTVSKLLAKEINGRLLDTGAFYRTITLALLQADIPAAEVTEEILESLEIRQEFNDNKTAMFLNGVDVSESIRSEYISKQVSSYASSSLIRKYAVSLQQTYINFCVQNNVDVVIEGRDIATVVAPDADVKIFLTASAEVRARRRSEELSSDVVETLESINLRDQLDTTREVSPLRKSHDAIEVDASDKSLEEVVDLIKSLIENGEV